MCEISKVPYDERKRYGAVLAHVATCNVSTTSMLIKLMVEMWSMVVAAHLSPIITPWWKSPSPSKLPRSSTQKVALQYLWRKKWYLPASTVSVMSSAIISAATNMYKRWNTLLNQNWQEKVNLTVPRWIAMLTKLDKRPMHWCEEVNTEGIREITWQTRNIWWSCRYGILSTPQISPSADRMTRPTEIHTVEISGEKQLWKRAHRYKWQRTTQYLVLQCTRETLAKDQ
jgi:hypothetical protein